MQCMHQQEKGLKASRDEEEILRRDQQANEAMARAYERATQAKKRP